MVDDRDLARRGGGDAPAGPNLVSVIVADRRRAMPARRCWWSVVMAAFPSSAAVRDSSFRPTVATVALDETVAALPRARCGTLVSVPVPVSAADPWRTWTTTPEADTVPVAATAAALSAAPTICPAAVTVAVAVRHVDRKADFLPTVAIDAAAVMTAARGSSSRPMVAMPALAATAAERANVSRPTVRCCRWRRDCGTLDGDATGDPDTGHQMLVAAASSASRASCSRPALAIAAVAVTAADRASVSRPTVAMVAVAPMAARPGTTEIPAAATCPVAVRAAVRWNVSRPRRGDRPVAARAAARSKVTPGVTLTPLEATAPVAFRAARRARVSRPIAAISPVALERRCAFEGGGAGRGRDQREPDNTPAVGVDHREGAAVDGSAGGDRGRKREPVASQHPRPPKLVPLYYVAGVACVNSGRVRPW